MYLSVSLYLCVSISLSLGNKLNGTEKWDPHYNHAMAPSHPMPYHAMPSWPIVASNSSHAAPGNVNNERQTDSRMGRQTDWLRASYIHVYIEIYKYWQADRELTDQAIHRLFELSINTRTLVLGRQMLLMCVGKWVRMWIPERVKIPI